MKITISIQSTPYVYMPGYLKWCQHVFKSPSKKDRNVVFESIKGCGGNRPLEATYPSLVGNVPLSSRLETAMEHHHDL